jgi:hypothetical protein
LRWLSSGNRRKTVPIPRDIIGFDAKSTVEARHTRLTGNQESEPDKLLGGSVCLFRPTDMNHLCQEGGVIRKVDDSGMRSFREDSGRNFNFLDPLLRLLH